ncbi:probable DNA topoisomerase 2 [Vigna umbellata]|uniref:probable DNA topoisomerase 2 n=1 Tax=Vigna umbellata TaxID=87088 RepID=UPI001F5ED625|nr:probable DNA topoisomerase 2 [Vigna umbellata]
MKRHATTIDNDMVGDNDRGDAMASEALATENVPVSNDKQGKTIPDLRRLVSYVPGLYKISNEILVNTVDNKQRDPSMAALKVTINAKQNIVFVFNNGDAIPVEIPKLICGHLLTNNNYDDNIKKTTGGCNDYSAKLTNIFSTKFIIKIVDEKGKKKTQFCLIGTSKESSSFALVSVRTNAIGYDLSPEIKCRKFGIPCWPHSIQGIAISYVFSQEKGFNEIVSKAMGRAINKTVTIVELIKRRIVGLHQNTTIGSTDIIDTWEPLEEGLLPLETTRHVSMITIILSKNELDTSSVG